jgi:hypothetical protein
MAVRLVLMYIPVGMMHDLLPNLTMQEGRLPVLYVTHSCTCSFLGRRDECRLSQAGFEDRFLKD